MNGGEGEDSHPPSRDPGSDIDNGDADGGNPAANGDFASDNEDTPDVPIVPLLPLAKGTTRDSSPALTEEEDAHDHSTDYSAESEEDEDRPEENEEDNEDQPDEDEEGELDAEPPKNVDTAPVVPVAPAGSSIMAGQQLIKTPSASPSTSPEPEEHEGTNTPLPEQNMVKDEPVEPAVVIEAENDDDTEMAERPDPDADPDAEAEAEAEEADLELQPAHRAEALDVLAQIELRFGLVREALYIEKMEELAVEEAMIFQGALTTSIRYDDLFSYALL